VREIDCQLKKEKLIRTRSLDWTITATIAHPDKEKVTRQRQRRNTTGTVKISLAFRPQYY
jgi:hypothetical protein